MPHDFIQPTWEHVFRAFVDGAKEQRDNPSATQLDAVRAADGYTKRIHEEVDPETERKLRENDWPDIVNTAPDLEAAYAIFETARNGSTRPVGTLRGIREVIKSVVSHEVTVVYQLAFIGGKGIEDIDWNDCSEAIYHEIQNRQLEGWKVRKIYIDVI